MRKRVLFIAGPALGHVGRSLVIARALSRLTNAEVHFASASPGFAAQVITDEYPLSLIPVTQWGGESAFAETLERVVGSLKPDLVCLDINPLSWLSLERFPAIPQVYITNWFLTRLGPWETVQDRWFAKHRDTWNELRSKRRLDPLHHSRQLYERDLVLLCDPPGLFTENRSLPTYMHLVGSCFWALEGDLPEELDSIDGCVFVSFGSTGKKPLPPCIPESISRLVDTDTVVWLGKQVGDPETAPTSGYRHLIYSWLPTPPILSKARFVITQGGAGSTYQALDKGIPVGVWPTSKNQELLGDIVEAAGVGINLESASVLKSTGARHRIDAMISAARHLSAGTSMQQGPEIAAGKIMGLL